MSIVFFGPPGSGKGTQSTLLAKALGMPRVVAGDLLRAEKRSGSHLGQQISSIIDRGDFVPPQMIVGLIKDKVASLKCEDDVIFDGFPRTYEQAELFDGKISHIIYLNLDFHLCKFRLATRQEGRADDDPAVIQKRIEVYTQESEPMLEYYGGLDLVREIDGSQTPQEIHARIEDLVMSACVIGVAK